MRLSRLESICEYSCHQTAIALKRLIAKSGLFIAGLTWAHMCCAQSISSVAPSSAKVGAAVVIAGSGFGSTQGSSGVTFNGITATASSWSATSVTVSVPTGAVSGNVVVKVGSQSSNGVSFTLIQTAPVVTWSTPAAVSSGTELSTTQLSATANVAGSFAYTPAAPAGTYPGIDTLSVLFTPTNATDYSLAASNVALTVTGGSGPEINTIAGNGTAGYAGDGGAATAGELNNPCCVAMDSAGNIYVSDTHNSRIRKISASTGVITTIAGNGTGGFSGDGAAATAAELNGPNGIAVDANRNVYIADQYNNRVRMVNASTGVISTVAGNGTAGFSGDGGLATNAELNQVAGVYVDASGNLYLADNLNERIRKVTASTGNISTIAGNGTAGFSGDGGSALSAELNSPNAISIDSSNNIYIADHLNSRIRKITASTGNISTVAGSGIAGFIGDGGPASNTSLNLAQGIALDAAGDIYFTDKNGQRLRKITASTGIVSAVAGYGSSGFTGDGQFATAAELSNPGGIVVDGDGNIYFADSGNNRIRAVSFNKVNPTVSWAPPSSFTYGTTLSSEQLNASANIPGTFTYVPVSGSVPSAGTNTLSVVFTPVDTTDYNVVATNISLTVTGGASPVINTIAGNGTGGYSGDGGVAGNAEFNNPCCLVMDSAGNMFLSDTHNSRVRKISASTGIVTTIAGNGTAGYSGDGGAATSAELNTQNGIAVDTAGNLFIADQYNNRVRKVAASNGTISTVAGNGTAGFSGDGGAATSAELNQPTGVAIDSSGNLYISDNLNQRIRMVAASSGVITTVAGNGGAGTAGDGGPATSAQLNAPGGLAFDSSGNLYITDHLNSRIRKLTISTGVITTIAGGGIAGFIGDGGPAANTTINLAQAVALDSAGNVYFSDKNGQRVREVNVSSGVVTTIAGNGASGSSGDGGPATSAALQYPGGIAIDSSGNLYFVDSGNNRIRSVTRAKAAPAVTWPSPASISYGTLLGNSQLNATANVAGSFAYTPAAGMKPSAGTATLSATFTPTNTTEYSTVSTQVSLVVTQATPTVTWPTPASIAYGTALSGAQLNATASVPGSFAYTPLAGSTPLPGTDTLSVTFTPSDTVNYQNVSQTVSLSVQKTPLTVTWPQPSSISAGTILGSNQLNATATIPGTFAYSPAAGTGATTGNDTLSVIFTPSDLTDYSPVAMTVPLIVTGGFAAPISTVAGNGGTSYGLDGESATAVGIATPYGVAADASGRVFLSDRTGAIRRVDPGTGAIYTIAAAGTVGGPRGLAIDPTTTSCTPSGSCTSDSNSNVYVADALGNIWEVPYSGGTALKLSETGLKAPMGVALDFQHNIYVADTGNNRIVKGNTTVAGNGTEGFSGDGGPATFAELAQPTAVAIDSSGNLYIADQLNNRIRRVDASSHVITTFAGGGLPGFLGDGGPASNATLSTPTGVSVDPAGNVYISEMSGQRIRKVVASTGYITTIAGYGTAGFSGDGGPGTDAEVQSPTGVSLTPNGNVLFADSANNRVRLVSPYVTLQWYPAHLDYGNTLGPAQFNATSSVPGTFDYSANPTGILPVGEYVLSTTFTPTDTVDYQVTSLKAGVDVSQAIPVITWPAPANIPDGTELTSGQLDATANVAGQMHYSPDFNTVLSPGLHTLSVEFVPSDTTHYTNAEATVPITVGKTGYDFGTVTLLVTQDGGSATVAASTTYGDVSTTASVAEGLAANVVSDSPVNVTPVDNILYITSKNAGAAVNYYYGLQFTYDSSSFSQPSFAANPSSGLLSGDQSSNAAGQWIYGYNIPILGSSLNSGYAANGNLLSVSDFVMDSWTLSYDDLNRLSLAESNGGGAGTYYCWSYDNFGNRLQQEVSSAAFQAGSGGTSTCQPQTQATTSRNVANYAGTSNGTNNNQMSSTSQNANQASGYDASGDITSDGVNQYLYDGDGRICAVSQPFNGMTIMTGYIYDAEGRRVAKGSISTWSCDPSANGFTATANYILGLSGEQLTEVDTDSDGTTAWAHTNVFAGGELMATYDPVGLHFFFNDWLGTRRAQTDYAGVPEQSCSSLPFGDGLSCPSTAPTEHHFTGKERDAESGLDYFGARYYASSMGRFSSPDPSGLYFADPTNPQSLNLYAYALNNPLRYTDPTGLYCFYGDPNNSNDNMDASQFDYHSSQSECTAPDENGNSGQWINDGATHYTVDGYVDDEGRPDNYVVDANVNSGPSTNIIQTAVSDYVSILTTVGGAAADLAIGVSNQLTSLIGYKPMPYFRLFGTHYCGPGGGGSANGGLDPACQAHDNCYATAGLSASSNGSGASLTLDQAAAAQGCNQALYDAARGHPNQLNGSAPLRQWLTGGDQVPFGHLAPGTEAQPW